MVARYHKAISRLERGGCRLRRDPWGTYSLEQGMYILKNFPFAARVPSGRYVFASFAVVERIHPNCNIIAQGLENTSASKTSFKNCLRSRIVWETHSKHQFHLFMSEDLTLILAQETHQTNRQLEGYSPGKLTISQP